MDFLIYENNSNDFQTISFSVFNRNTYYGCRSYVHYNHNVLKCPWKKKRFLYYRKHNVFKCLKFNVYYTILKI